MRLRRLLNPRPLISVVVIAYNMPREISRTLHTLSRSYQQNSADTDWEVILVDNGSKPPLDIDARDIGVPLRSYYLEEASPSPAGAVNYGVQQAQGDYVAIMIDGARMLSPGVVAGARRAVKDNPEPVIAVLGLHLGPDHQRNSVNAGYTQSVEDRLLAHIDWPSDGYRLFEIASWGGSCPQGWFGPIAESNCIVVSQRLFQSLSGFDEAFQSPGGGLVNLDFYKRAVEHKGVVPIYLAGEGSFHQLHEGVTTGDQESGRSFDELNEEYAAIRGNGFVVPEVNVRLFGADHGSGRFRYVTSEDAPIPPTAEAVQATCAKYLPPN